MTNKFKMLTVSASVLAASFAVTTTATAETLAEAVDTTIQSNPEILSQAQYRKSVDQTIDIAESGYKPTLDINLGIGKERTENLGTRPGHVHRTRGEAGFNATQMLYDGFATKSAVDQASSLAESAGYGVFDATETTSLSAVETYLNVLRRTDLHGLTTNNLDSHEKIFSQIEQRSESGIGNSADLEQTKGRLALAQANVMSTEGNLADANTNYNRVVGHMPEGLSDPGLSCCDKAPATLDDALKIAYSQHPAIRAAIADHEASLASVDGANAAFHPNVNVEVSGRADNDLDGDRGYEKELLAMLRLRWNLINGGADTARVEETEIRSQQAREEANSIVRDIEQDVRLAWNALDDLSHRLPVLEQRKASAEQTRDAYQQQFNLGQRTLLDLLDTENEVLTASTDYTNAYYEHIFACYWLSESMGKLLEHLELAAPEEAILVSAE
jgi:adhesin transport system outer membrane protein